MDAARRRSHGGGQCGGPRLIRKMSLSLQTVACGAPWPSKLPAPGGPEPGVDATAIHGRLGARVALLQSPILPIARSAYILAQKFQKLSVDKPHTRVWRVWRASGPANRPSFSCLSSLSWFLGSRFMVFAGLGLPGIRRTEAGAARSQALRRSLRGRTQCRALESRDAWRSGKRKWRWR